VQGTGGAIINFTGMENFQPVKRNQSGKYTLIVVGVFLLFCVLLSTRFYFLFVLENEFTQPTSGATDKIVWEEDESGVRIKEIFNSGNSGLKTGDLLVKVDYKNIHRLSQLNRILSFSNPGDVLLYQVKRTAPDGIDQTYRQHFVRLYEKPEGIIVSGKLAAQVGFWVSIFIFLSLFIIFLILFPFFRESFRKFYLTAILLACSLLFYSFYSILFISYSINFQNLHFAYFIQVYLTLLVTILSGFMVLHATKSIPVKFVYLFSVPGLILFFLYFLKNTLSGPSFLFESTVRMGCYGINSFLILIYLIERNKEDSIVKPVFRSLLIIWVILVTIVSGISITEPLDPYVNNPWQMLPGHFTLALGPLVLAYRQLRFGKIRLVVSRAILYFALFSLVLLIYLVLIQIMNPFFGDSYIRDITVLVGLILTGFGFRFLIQKYFSDVQRYFTSRQQNRENELITFIERIPRIPSTTELVSGVQLAVSNYAEASVELKLPERLLSGTTQDNFEELEKFFSEGKYWSANRELNRTSLPLEIEAELTKQYALIFPVVSEDKKGLLFIGRKKKGVYNLEDVELFQRTVAQTQIALELLSLLENEKLLLKENLEARMIALRAQINPHFLFNTLNTISALIHDSPDLAEEAVDKLAFIFRYTLKNSTEMVMPLRDEIELVSKYLAIEQIRFGERLTVQIELPDSCREFTVPSLVIQTLVENCIKHGIAKVLHPGWVHITVQHQNQHIQVVVEDNGAGISTDRIEKGTGLRNVIARLNNLYHESNLIVFENTGHGTRVTLTLPVHQKLSGRAL
jgi:signal transduction histidine kinase